MTDVPFDLTAFDTPNTLARGGKMFGTSWALSLLKEKHW